MKRVVAQMGALLPVLAFALMSTRMAGQELPKKDRDAGAEKPALKADPAVIAELIQQLGSVDFKMREKASQRLAELDEVPDALAQPPKAPMPRLPAARMAITVVTARVDERAFQILLRELHKVELDRFVHRMVTDEKFAGASQWKIIQAIAKAVTNEARTLADRKYTAPEFDVQTLRQLRFKGATQNLTWVDRSVVLMPDQCHTSPPCRIPSLSSMVISLVPPASTTAC